MAREVLETAVQLPDGACRLLVALRLLQEQGEVATRDRLASLLGKSTSTISRIMTDLARTNVITRDAVNGGTSQGVKYTWLISNNADFSIRKDKAGKVKRCAVRSCRRVNPQGVFCEKCKQTQRKDRAWRKDAIRLACEERGGAAIPTPYKVQKQLVGMGYESIPLWDKARGSNDKRASGLVSVLLEAGLLADEWADHQRAALGGESEEW